MTQQPLIDKSGSHHQRLANLLSSQPAVDTSTTGSNQSGRRNRKKRQCTRENQIEFCTKCNVQRLVNKDMARMSCPVCGECRVYASHIFDAKEKSAVQPITTDSKIKHTSTNMHRYTAQYERGFPPSSIEVIEGVVKGYHRIHSHDPSKVRLHKTLRIIKDSPTIPSSLGRSADRISRELRRDSIPEFSTTELDYLIEHASSRSSDNMQRNKPIASYLMESGRTHSLDHSRLLVYSIGNSGKHKVVRRQTKRGRTPIQRRV